MTCNIDQLISKFPKRSPDSHKGDYGHVLVLAGSAGFTGAPYLTGQAALLAGSGLVTLAAARSIWPILAAKLTEVMVRPVAETKEMSPGLPAENDILDMSHKCSVIAIGPGLSRNNETMSLVRRLVARLERLIVLDADGINAFEGRLSELKAGRSGLILTPHDGEFSRLTGITLDELKKSRKDIALNFANEYNSVLILKGHHTIVAAPGGNIYVNDTGNAGMATGGTGDILTGMVAGFAAQGCDPFAAACIAAHYHGLAGDIAVKEKGPLSLIASDLLNVLPVVLRKLA